MKKIFKTLLIVVTVFFMANPNVKAAVAYSKLDGYIKYSSSYTYTNYYTRNPGGDYTLYKSLCTNNGVTSSCSGEEIAYCAQSSKKTPNNDTRYQTINYGDTYANKTWDYRRAARVGYIINTINKKYCHYYQ